MEIVKEKGREWIKNKLKDKNNLYKIRFIKLFILWEKNKRTI